MSRPCRLSRLRGKLYRAYWRARSWVLPQNRWVTRAVGRQWVDKDVAIEAVLFAALVSYVEEEQGLERMGHAPEVAAKLRAAYQWAKERDAAYEALDWTVANGVQCFAAEQCLIRHDTEHLTAIVRLRRYLWT